MELLAASLALFRRKRFCSLRFAAFAVLLVVAACASQAEYRPQEATTEPRPSGEQTAPAVQPESPSAQAPDVLTPTERPETPVKPSVSPSMSAKPLPNFQRQAWELLRSGVKEDKTDRRAAAVRALSLLRGESRAVKLAASALGDGKARVRVAACDSLGELRASSAITKLRPALDDKEISVVLAAAQALHKLKDPAGDEAYFSILTGERKGTKGLVAGQLDTLKDPKKMALLGFEEGIGFVPFGGIGYSAFKALHTDDSATVRAGAARMVAHDPDVATQKALVQAATSDKSALVRAAALVSLSERGNASVIEDIAGAMSDGNDVVKYTAAATVVHLNSVSGHKGRNHK